MGLGLSAVQETQIRFKWKDALKKECHVTPYSHGKSYGIEEPVSTIMALQKSETCSLAIKTTTTNALAKTYKVYQLVMQYFRSGPAES